MEWSVLFSSQMSFQPYGHLICTPISLLAGTSYLKKCNDAIVGKSDQNSFDIIQQLFTPQYVHQMMLASHSLYKDHFSQSGQQLMIQDLYQWIPSDAFSILEAGGLILAEGKEEDTTTSHIKKKFEKDDILIMPLFSLLHRFLDFSIKNQDKTSIVVTTEGHTTCFMCNERGDLFIFDSLPAVLTMIPRDRMEEAMLGPLTKNSEYSAIVLRNKKPSYLPEKKDAKLYKTTLSP